MLRRRRKTCSAQVEVTSRAWKLRRSRVQAPCARGIVVSHVYRCFAHVEFSFFRCTDGLRTWNFRFAHGIFVLRGWGSAVGKKIGGRGRFGVYSSSPGGLPHTSPPLTSLTESHSFDLPERITHHE